MFGAWNAKVELGWNKNQYKSKNKVLQPKIIDISDIQYQRNKLNFTLIFEMSKDQILGNEYQALKESDIT